jgi:hypothetical protein
VLPAHESNLKNYNINEKDEKRRKESLKFEHEMNREE